MMDAALGGAFRPTLVIHSALNIDGGWPVGKPVLCEPLRLSSLPQCRRQTFQVSCCCSHMVLGTWSVLPGVEGGSEPL